MKVENRQGFSVVELAVVNGVLLVLAAAFAPAITNAQREAALNTVAAHGKDIFVAIVGANVEREPLGLKNVWPKTQAEAEVERWERRRFDGDISTMTFQNSTKYFYELFDGANIGNPRQWAPYVINDLADYSKLAGAGVPAKVGAGELQPENNIWCIAGNIRDEMEDVIPVLVTRNVDCASLYKDYDGKAETPLRWSQKYNTPFANENFIMVRKGGAIFKGTAQSAFAHTVYAKQSFKTTAEGHAPLVYLTPDSIAHPH